MINSSSQKHNARQLRQQGLSFRDIANELIIPLSTTHLWTKDIAITDIQKQKLIYKQQLAFVRGRKIAQKYKKKLHLIKIKKSVDLGSTIIGKLSNRDVLIIGASLYWGEGFKKDSRFGFANSDPNMIIFMLSWLKDNFNIDVADIRLRLGININLKHRVTNIEERWSKLTRIPLQQFQKPFFQKSKQIKTYLNSESYLGVLRIRVNNHPEILPTIMGMLEKIKKNYSLGKY